MHAVTPFFFINRQKVPRQIVGCLNMAAVGGEVRSLNGSVLQIDTPSQLLCVGIAGRAAWNHIMPGLNGNEAP